MTCQQYLLQSMNPKLDKYNAFILKSLIRARLNNQINKIQTPMCLYANDQILSIINYVYDYKFSGEAHKGSCYTLEYDSQAIDIDSSPNIMFMIYPDPKMVNVLASMIKNNEASNVKKNYYAFFVPAKDFLCAEALDSLNIASKIKAKNFNFDFIPLTDDLLSLEMPPLVKQLNLQKYIIQSLLRICNIIGQFKGIYSLGQKSQRIIKNFQVQTSEIPQISLKESSSSYLLMLDRQIDLVTPMLTSFSYQSLLDMFFGIKFNKVQLPGQLIKSDKKLDTFLLNTSKDIHYPAISKMQIRQVPEYLLQKSEQLSDQIKKLKSQASNLDDLNKINQQLMGQLLYLQHHKSIVTFLLNHINSCPFINTATLESVSLQNCQRAQNIEYLSLFYPIQQVLKLQILSSQVSQLGSYYSRFQKTIMQMILQCYHPKHLITIKNLVQNKILKSSKTPLKWKEICDKYDLIPDQPHPYTYIHIIYSSLLVRFVELFLTDNLNVQMINLVAEPANAKGYNKGKFHKIKKGDIVYLYIVGGITYSETQSFRILGEKMGIKFIVCTDHMTSGQDLIKRNF